MAAYSQGVYGEEEDPQKPKAGATGGTAGAVGAGAQQPQQPQTFAQLQQGGYARPPMPNITPTVQTPGHPALPQGGAGPNVGPTALGAQQGGFQGFDPLSQGMGQAYQNYQGPGGFQQPNNPLQQGLQQSLQQGLQDPSRYSSGLAQNTFNSMNAQLGQGYEAERQRINEDMARRGLYSSTVASGRLGDLASNQARAQSDLALGILRDQAGTYGADRNQAQQAAMGYGQNQFSNALQGYGANLQGQGQGFGQQQQLLQNLLGYGQQSFNNQMQQNQFNWQQQTDQAALEQRLMALLYGGGQ